MAGALALAADGIRTGGDPRNREYASPALESGSVAEERLALAYDPQTAGGLLVSLPEEKAAVLEASFAAAQLFLRRVGRVETGSGLRLA
jgi:selenide, water dikinase